MHRTCLPRGHLAEEESLQMLRTRENRSNGLQHVLWHISTLMDTSHITVNYIICLGKSSHMLMLKDMYTEMSFIPGRRLMSICTMWAASVISPTSTGIEVQKIPRTQPVVALICILHFSINPMIQDRNLMSIMIF
ncbi:hypothetical protein KP509_24G068900 [Ceratopteris richardii]|uniref:Uncharacterized protein n=1 Tax=Ceratopteris richardii TaxID=49495 RepID=A0A8T2RXH5_CERRI|nr:hypothetical protein KP509_24G068900 [Ceratopteris richardii]